MIRIDQPKLYDLVSNKIMLGGMAGGAFEASYNWRVSEGHDEVTGYFMAGDGTGGRGQYQLELDVSGASFKNPLVTIDVFHTSAKDGRELEKRTVPVFIGNMLVPDYTNYFPHKVVEGDTLWSIAKKYYGNGSMWPTLIVHNAVAHDKAILYPGDTVRVPR